MNAFFRTAARWLAVFIVPRQILSWRYLLRYAKHWRLYQSRTVEEIRFADSYPCLTDWVRSTPYDPHYFYQGAWLARRLAEAPPQLHVDVGSSVMMVNVLSASVPMVFVDYRPLVATLSGLRSIAGDATRLPFADSSLDSVSSLHVIEHVGLGRYGDPLSPAGSQLAASELQRVLRPGGRLFLSVPVGRERVCFNAHRVFETGTIQSFVPALRLESFSLVDDAGRFAEQVPVEAADGLDYGCGLFEFVKARA